MCLITEQQEPITLDKSIYVYKWLKHGIKSPHFNMRWLKKKIYHQELFIDKYTGKIYADNTALIYYQPILPGCHSITIGLHAYRTIKRAYDGLTKYEALCEADKTGEILCKMRIPKGSQVYYDATGLIVSNQMILL